LVADEVNCKIQGLETQHRRDLNKKFKFEIPGARYMPAVRLGRWDGCQTFFQISGSTYINLLPEILPELVNWGYEIAVDDQRQYRTDYVFEPVTDQLLSHRVWPDTHPAAGQPIVLRDYQVEAVNGFLTNTQSIQNISTAAGKTLITTALAHVVGQHGRSMLIVPSKSLVMQTVDDYNNAGLNAGVVYGDLKQLDCQHTVCTWQSLNSLLKRDREALGQLLDGCVCVMVDECHTLAGDKLQSLMTDIMSRVPIRWALTGTIPKEPAQWRSLQVCVGPVVNRIAAVDLQEKGVLANCQVNIMQLVDHSEYRDYQSELKYLLENADRLKHIAGMIQGMTGNTMVLIDRVEPGRLLAELIPDSVFISGATRAEARREQYNEINFADGKILVATYGIASTGINVTKVHNLVLIEPGKSFVRVIQSIGRGLRKGFDKDHVQIWDITSTCKFARRHLTKRRQYYTESCYPYTTKKVNWKD
jgi:superfamily II DNA or RNA helicase